MIDAATREQWSLLDAKLRPFIARRVRSSSDVDDVVQDVFLRLQRGLAGLRDDDRFGPWVYQVARSAIADHHRNAARHPLATSEVSDVSEVSEVCEAFEDTNDTENENPHDAEQELATYVAAFVAMLPSPYREALTLTELEGLTQREAATMLGISLSGMKSRVQRGREQLRETFEACCNIALDARGHVLACEPRPDGRLPDCQCAKSALSSS